MAQQGDDCYFYYYSACSKDLHCPFRHCEAALGNETVCTLWQEGKCHRKICKFRHMNIQKDRSTIPCYWESQPSGCAKTHCPFKHSKSKTSIAVERVPFQSIPSLEEHENDTCEETRTFVQTDPDKRSILSRIGHEDIEQDSPSPKVEPVVVNFDESDQESFTTSPVKVERLREVDVQPRILRTTKKTPKEKSPGVFDLPIKSLEDIRKEKTSRKLNVSPMEKPSVPAAYLEDTCQESTNTVNIQRKPTARKEEQGKKKVEPSTIVIKSLDEIKKGKTVSSEVKNTSETIKIKTLEEIIREKEANKKQNVLNGSTTNKLETKPTVPKVARRLRQLYIPPSKQDKMSKLETTLNPSNINQSVKTDPIIQTEPGKISIKSFEEIMAEKRKRKQENPDGASELVSSPKRTKTLNVFEKQHQKDIQTAVVHPKQQSPVKISSHQQIVNKDNEPIQIPVKLRKINVKRKSSEIIQTKQAAVHKRKLSEEKALDSDKTKQTRADSIDDEFSELLGDEFDDNINNDNMTSNDDLLLEMEELLA